MTVLQGVSKIKYIESILRIIMKVVLKQWVNVRLIKRNGRKKCVELNFIKNCLKTYRVKPDEVKSIRDYGSFLISDNS